jgi:hypothetical protein
MAKKRVRVIDQLQAVALATRFLITRVPDADFREVWARLDEGRWWVSFGKVFPPNVVECPGGWCVTVDAKTGKAKWFPTL